MAHLDALLKAGGWTLAQYREWSFEYMDLYKKRKEMKKDVEGELERANIDLKEDLEKANTTQATARETGTVVRIREWDSVLQIQEWESEDEDPDAEFKETGTTQARAPRTTAAVRIRQFGFDHEHPDTEVKEIGAIQATARKTTVVVRIREWRSEDEDADAEFDKTNKTQVKAPKTPAEDSEYLCEGLEQASTAKTGPLATPAEDPQNLREGSGETSSSMQATPPETLKADPPACRQQSRGSTSRTLST